MIDSAIEIWNYENLREFITISMDNLWVNSIKFNFGFIRHNVKRPYYDPCLFIA